MTDTSTVTVKQLVWESVHRDYVETYQAKCAFGIYRIFEDEDSASAIWIEFAVHEDRFGMVDAVEVDRIYGEFSDAKAAAQADYEHRVRSALEPQTPAQAARVLLPIFEKRHISWAQSKARNPEDYTSQHSATADALRAIAGGE